MIVRLWRNLIAYLVSSKKELQKVVWPDREKTTRDTLVVIGISLAVAIFLGSLDFLFLQLLQLII